MQRTTGCSDIQCLFAETVSSAGLVVSMDRMNVSMLPRKALLGKWSFMQLKIRLVVYKDLFFTGIPGKNKG